MRRIIIYIAHRWKEHLLKREAITEHVRSYHDKPILKTSNRHTKNIFIHITVHRSQDKVIERFS